MTVWTVDRSGVEDAYTVGVFSTEFVALAFIEKQDDPWMYGVCDWKVDEESQFPDPFADLPPCNKCDGGGCEYCDDNPTSPLDLGS